MVIDEELLTLRAFYRKTYNSLERTFSLKIWPTEVHDVQQQWYRISEHRWRDSGLLKFDKLVYLQMGVGVRDSLGSVPTTRPKRPLYLASHKPDIPRRLI